MTSIPTCPFQNHVILNPDPVPGMKEPTSVIVLGQGQV